MRYRNVVALALVACSSPSEPARPPTPAPATAVIADALEPDALEPDAAEPPRQKMAQQEAEEIVRERERELGPKLLTCEGTAKIMAGPPGGGSMDLETRENAIFKMCTRDRWPMRVRECASTSLDVLACSAYLETKKQQKAWDAYFERLASER